MALIVEAGDPILRQTTRPFDGQVDDAELAQLAEVMRATMLAAPGVGLTGPQVGIGLSMFVAEDPGSLDPETAEVRQRSPMPCASSSTPNTPRHLGERRLLRRLPVDPRLPGGRRPAALD